MTRTLVITQNTTVDGRVEMLDDWFDDQAQADDGAFLAEHRRQRDASDALLVGRRTFTDMRGYWRDLEGDVTGVSDHLDRVRKHVVTSTLADGDLDWAGATALRGDVVEEIRALKESEGRDIVCTGSLSLLPTLIEADLVDEYRLWVYPVVQGRGRRLFPDGRRRDLRLLEARSFASGQALLTYAAR
ncbi:dihydrofolate reductase family protein [Nocardioides litoris]|uniref:dihydrofolate reductase family protein n=1 Tax=Nocardioides litoris TaxID=1926648 RepID=UPI00112473DC|nr:dihydrofolate reductase family protein [Nocardioides litoris]